MDSVSIRMGDGGDLRFQLTGAASDTSARAADAQSMSFCTLGAPLTPIVPTSSPFTLMGKPPPHAAMRASVGTPAKSDGSLWMKLKKSCVETPPAGDLVALKFLYKIPLLAAALKQPEAALSEILGHFRISLEGLHDLTSESADHFNSANPNQTAVKYLSFAGGGRAGLVPTSRFFLPYYEFIKAHVRGREVSDGVVTVSSAMWGTFDPNLWPGDHADEIGHDLDLPLHMPDTDTLHRYEQIVLRF